MSTRATYKFETEGDSVTFYIHHDGYEAGAAMYFNNMNNVPGYASRATKFLRANDGADFTAGHDAHGDTEYQYDIDREGNIIARSCASWENNGIPKTIFSGTVDEFIAKHPQLIETE